MKNVKAEKKNWGEYLDICIFACNTSHHKSTPLSPFSVMFGRKAYLPVDICISNSKQKKILRRWYFFVRNNQETLKPFAESKNENKDGLKEAKVLIWFKAI